MIVVVCGARPLQLSIFAFDRSALPKFRLVIVVHLLKTCLGSLGSDVVTKRASGREPLECHGRIRFMLPCDALDRVSSEHRNPVLYGFDALAGSRGL